MSRFSEVGFGRKSKPDFIIEAAVMSQAMRGAAVKVTWTREDDITHDYYHTVSLERLEAGLDADGEPVAWLHRSVAPTIMSIFMPDAKHKAPFELGMGLVDMPFAISNVRIENPEAMPHTRIGGFRSAYNVPHAFAVQSFAAELAARPAGFENRLERRDSRSLDAYLANPGKLVPGTTMAVRVPSANQHAAIIAYLKTLGTAAD